MDPKLHVPPLLGALWHSFEFKPNPDQEAAILHVDGPLFLPAGPGSGKTRVLLWRAVNLIAVHGVRPEEIFLSTFTEKAALQLRNGLRTLLTAVSEKTGQPYDTAKLYVGTVHSLCQRLLLDRRLAAHRSRAASPILLDELDQFMFLRRRRHWDAIFDAAKFESPDAVIAHFGDHGTSRLKAIGHFINFFNRLSEEMIDPAAARKLTDEKTLQGLLDAYAAYLELLRLGVRGFSYTDLSLIQTVAVKHLRQNPASGRVFRHVIVDEYQDTNPVQEQLFLLLAAGYKNLCVVGDDDQALYRFRGATVENFVEFPDRCKKHLKATPHRIILGKNYRSREGIVGFYNRFITHASCDWRKEGSRGAYRVDDKIIVPHRLDKAVAVVASSPSRPEDVAAEIAGLVWRLLKAKKVADPNQIAFLFPSLKSSHVDRMRAALEKVGLEVYAPRAGRFLEVPESQAVFGLLFRALGSFTHVHVEFQRWLTGVQASADALIAADPHLRRFIEKKAEEVLRALADYRAIMAVLAKKGWSPKDAFDPQSMQPILAATSGLSAVATRSLTGQRLARFARDRLRTGKPIDINFIVTRATSLDWNILDFFYQLGGFKEFKARFDLAENGVDEGPVCNLSLISRYLSRFIDQYPFPISGESLANEMFLRNLANYLYVLFRRGESEYEDASDPFPKGRIPFITIHQSKGLEFPVIILANPRKDPKLQPIEEMVAPLLAREGEPLERMPSFDVMRMFYVALSRAENLLVLAHFRGAGQRLHPAFADLIAAGMPVIPDLAIATVPAAVLEDEELPQSYSYTADFLLHQRCPRQYMIFRKYAFAPARSLTMFFGSLVHQTIEDLHQRLIDSRRTQA